MPLGSEPEVAVPPAAGRAARFDWRLVPALLLLVLAGFLTRSTVEALETRRAVRTELAEISHVRYDLLSADRWVQILTPILESQIDAIEFEPSRDANLRPMVQNALYRLLDDVKTQMSAPPPPNAPKPSGFGAFLGQGNAMVVNMIVGALRPHVPEYTDIVLKEIGRPESRRALNDALKKYIRTALADGATHTFGHVDRSWYNSILEERGCTDAAACKPKLEAEIRAWDAKIFSFYIPILAAAGVAFLLLILGRPGPLRPSSAMVLLAFCIVLLVGGLMTPMLEVEAKISQLKMTFLGRPITFTDQVLYFQSKSVLEVFRVLINMKRPDMWVVGVLVLMFSVVFPALKIISSLIYVYAPTPFRDNRLVRFFALESSKWSMADVMALAIFMSYVAFNGLIGNSMNILLQSGADLTIPTDSSKILPGYYLFIGFCLASLFLARKLARH